KEKQVKRIILTRPAVEAGENLGFLPGDMKEKLDPYMQPLYDALRDMLPPSTLEDYLLKGIIQIAPLAFMRGRTLDNAFVILDEAQNTTHSQMKMFLTRMGKNAKFIITGDPGQVDLPRKVSSGLKEALRILKDIDGIKIMYLDDKDIVRHRLVKRIVDAYKTVETDYEFESLAKNLNASEKKRFYCVNITNNSLELYPFNSLFSTINLFTFFRFCMNCASAFISSHQERVVAKYSNFGNSE